MVFCRKLTFANPPKVVLEWPHSPVEIARGHILNKKVEGMQASHSRILASNYRGLTSAGLLATLIIRV